MKEEILECYAIVFGDKTSIGRVAPSPLPFMVENEAYRIRHATEAVPIELTKQQFIALANIFRKEYKGNVRVSFILSPCVPYAIEIELKLLLRRTAEKKLLAERQEALDIVFRIVNEIREVDTPDVATLTKPSIIAESVKAPAVESAPADYFQQIQAVTGVAVPDIVAAYQESIEDSDGSTPNVNVVNQLTKEDMQEAVRYGVREGLLDTDALSQRARQKEIQARQEDMLLENGRTPMGAARILYPDKPEKHRAESQRISNEHNARKKKQK
jgi:hypothetical protein